MKHFTKNTKYIQTLRSLRFICIYLASLILCIPITAHSAELPEVHVLLINSYHPGYAWSDELERGLKEELDRSGKRVELSIEYLDTKRFPLPRQQPLLRNLLSSKYANYPPKVVVVSDNAAYDFIVQERDRLFPGIPIVFCGYNNYRPEFRQQLRQITGVNEVANFTGTIDMALGMHPKTRTLAFLLSSNDSTNQRIGETFEDNVLPGLRERFQVKVFKDVTLAALKRDLETLPPDSLLFIAGQVREQANGRMLTPLENGRLIATAGHVPAYSFWDFYIGTGIVGGHVLNGYDQGHAAADMVKRILDGTPADDIPLQMISPTTPMFSYADLTRFGIAKSSLPPNAKIVGEPDSVWHKYKEGILSAVALIVLQSLLIFWLLRSMRERRLALAQLAEQSNQLEHTVSERTRSLQRSEQRMRALLDTAHVCIFMVDADGRITHANRYMSELFGRPQDELIGSEYVSLIAPEERDSGRAKMLQLMRSEIGSVDVDRHYWRPDGSLFWGHLNGIQLRDESTGEFQLIGVIADINARKQAQQELERYQQHLESLVEARTQELQQAKDAAEAANRAKSAFLANMSHELRTPMNGVLGMIGLAQRRMADPNGRSQLDKATSAAKHLLTILNDILDISKIEAECMAFESHPLQLGPLLENMAHLQVGLARDKGLIFAIDLPPALADLPLLGDALRLNQILLNLVGNAIKFTHQGRVTLLVRAETEDAQHARIRFEVRDTGIGIPHEIQHRLFSPFEQGDNSTTRRFGGTGLGLAICKRLVELMGGEIGVDSTEGHGACFWFSLPLSKNAAPSASNLGGKQHDEAERALHRLHADKRLLLVEDDPLTADIVLTLLGDTGLNVEHAADGAAAVIAARQSAYDLILMDIQMPGLNGYDATRAIRQESLNRSTPIIAVTANAFDEDRQAAMAAGMNAHIAKPFLPETLYQTIHAWLSE